MTIQINRFEKQSIASKIKQVAFTEKTGIIIKDHKIDKIVCYVNVCNKLEDNKELADEIITTIEDYILEQENAED